MCKKVMGVNTSRLVDMFNDTEGLFKLRRHCIKHGDYRSNIQATGRCEVVELNPMSMGWLQGVYGPLPRVRPSMVAILEFTGVWDAVMLIPLMYDGMPYKVQQYDDVDEQEYCTWCDIPDMYFDEVMEYLKNGSVIPWCSKY